MGFSNFLARDTRDGLIMLIRNWEITTTYLALMYAQIFNLSAETHEHKKIDYRHPAVQKDLLDWGEWILDVRDMQFIVFTNVMVHLQTTGANGFRLDAVKHIDRKFLLHWVR